MTRTRVAITGMGVKTPAGCDLDTFWDTLQAGRSTAAPIRRIDPAPLPVRFATYSRMSARPSLFSAPPITMSVPVPFGDGMSAALWLTPSIGPSRTVDAGP